MSGLGSIELHDHQLSAVQRLNEAINRYGGALLCDEVGMGKTYVAIAIARRFQRAVVIAPAALKPMWQSALAMTSVDAGILSFEALSRIDSDAWRGKQRTQSRYDFVIIDEAHHARNPRTNRYFALENLVRHAKVLLLSATPIHNNRADLISLLFLFLGSRARSMTAAELAECVVRREQQQVALSARMPVVRPAVRHGVNDSVAIVQALLNLPPPVPVRDGDIAAALVGRGLVHQWASSEAALHEAVRRRIARATALCISLEAGTYPSDAELRSWIYDEGAMQLGFAELLSSPVANHAELLAGVRAHLAALTYIRSRFRSTLVDAERANILAAIRSSTPRARIVAFAQYSETVAMLYRRLAPTGYVALLTSHGARVAGGALTRKEAIARFAPVATRSIKPRSAEAIELLLTTDLLSEGVNLQDADTVVHVDIPWTAARMEQRVGRAARLGCQHAEVHVHVIEPPRSAARILESEPIVHRKWRMARAEESLPRKVERLRGILDAWRQNQPIGNHATTLVAAVLSEMVGFIAAISLDGAPNLVVCCRNRVSVDLDDQLDVCAAAQLEDGEVVERTVASAIQSIEQWCDARRAAAAAGVNTSRAQRRRELIARIDSSIESAPPHQRGALLLLAEKARNVATTSHGASIERELEAFLHTTMPDEEWLAAIANIDTQQAIRSDEKALEIHAILLLTLTPRRSPSPLDRESP